MAKEISNRRSQPVKLIIDQSNETIDFVQFVEDVLGYALAEKNKSDGSEVSNETQGEPDGLNKGK